MGRCGLEAHGSSSPTEGHLLQLQPHEEARGCGRSCGAFFIVGDLHLLSHKKANVCAVHHIMPVGGKIPRKGDKRAPRPRSRSRSRSRSPKRARAYDKRAARLSSPVRESRTPSRSPERRGDTGKKHRRVRSRSRSGTPDKHRGKFLVMLCMLML